MCRSHRSFSKSTDLCCCERDSRAPSRRHDHSDLEAFGDSCGPWNNPASRQNGQTHILNPRLTYYTAVDFVIKYDVWESRWFRIFCLGLCLIMAALFYRCRMFRLPATLRFDDRLVAPKGKFKTPILRQDSEDAHR